MSETVIIPKQFMGNKDFMNATQQAYDMGIKFGQRNKWRPIEEAPKDGTWFLAWWDGETRVAKYSDHFGCFVVNLDLSGRPRSEEPAYFMPLPTKPQTEQV